MSVRFAPSPTGVFHLGNLRTAWISREWASALAQPWVVRFEDIDTPRVVKGAQEQQLKDMAALGLRPDLIVVQSQRRSRHWELFEKARREGAVYPCACSRREVLESLASAPHGPEEAIYTGRCRAGGGAVKGEVAWRFRNEEASGAQDFIMARGDGSEASFQPAYHWACAIDDADGGHQLLVRAYDLESVVSLQRKIMSWMGVKSVPAVFHTSLVVTDEGKRLEKRTKGVTLAELKLPSDELLNNFSSGFKAEGFAVSRVWGESSRTLTLKELGVYL